MEVARFDAADGLYDCCWSEENESVLVSASGDGSVKVWDVAAPPQANPLRSLEEHTHEVYAVHWNQVRKDCFLSASWDDTVKLWSLAGPPASLRTFAEHSYCVYAAVWSPQHADIFATASGDCTLKVFDARTQFSTLTIPAHEYEILCCDWNKYNDCVVATGSVDKTVKPVGHPPAEAGAGANRGASVRGAKGALRPVERIHRVHVFVRHDGGDVGLQDVDGRRSVGVAAPLRRWGGITANSPSVSTRACWPRGRGRLLRVGRASRGVAQGHGPGNDVSGGAVGDVSGRGAVVWRSRVTLTFDDKSRKRIVSCADGVWGERASVAPPKIN